jgi:uncharacterized protein DUF2690
MRSITRYLAPVGIAAVLAFGNGALSPVRAAASTCYGATCNQVDPNGTSCTSDAYTVQSVWHNDYRVDLRYSPSCNANWGRIVFTTQTWHAISIDSLCPCNNNSSRSGEFSPIWTEMVDGSYKASACGIDLVDYQNTCTNYY